MTEFAGTLRERVTIEERLPGRDARGGANGAYAFAGECWASLMPVVPGDLTRAGALSFRPRWRVTMRKRESLSAHSRLLWRGKRLAVRGIGFDPAEPAQLVLTCEEVG